MNFKSYLSTLSILCIFSSCGLLHKNQNSKKLNLSEYNRALVEFSEKYSFPKDHIDTLRKIQPFIYSEDISKVDSILNVSLYDFLVEDHGFNFESDEFDTFYYNPKRTVAFYNYVFEYSEVKEIENGIKIKQP